MKKTSISGWGNNRKVYTKVLKPNNILEIQNILKSKKKIISRGLGRSYGDSSINRQNTIDMTRDAGMYICADVIAGLWDDDEASILKTRDFMIKNLFEWVNVYPCFAYPGTPLYKQYIDLGRIPVPTKWDIYGLYSAECNPLPTKHLSSSDVLKLRDYMFDSYYRNPDILAMIKKKFGEETHNHVINMVEKPLKRNIISNDIHNETIGSNKVFDNSKIENWYSGELIV